MALLNHQTQSTNYQTPRWVKFLGIAIITLILLFVVLQFIVGGEHGPNRHLPSNNATEVDTQSVEHNGQHP